MNSFLFTLNILPNTPPTDVRQSTNEFERDVDDEAFVVVIQVDVVMMMVALIVDRCFWLAVGCLTVGK